MATLGNLDKENENDDLSIQRMVVEYFSDPDADLEDESVHACAVEQGIEPDDMEEACYELLHCLFSEGESSEEDEKSDPEQLKMGMEVEAEHSENLFIRRKIVKDHLAEDPKYYTKLEKAGL